MGNSSPRQIMFAVWASIESDLKTDTPWGQVTVNTTGHCADNGCGGHSCYDFATIRGLDREVSSIAVPGGEALQNPDFNQFFSFNNMAEVQEAYDAEHYDFYQTLEDFACCDCTDCMRLTDCYANITQVPGDISCADIWQQVVPFVNSKAELMDVFNTLNVGGCYWCNDLYSQLSDTAVRAVQNELDFYDFPFPDENTVLSTEATTTTTDQFNYYAYTPLESCATVGCGNVGTECSCDVNCAADFETTQLPCCFDYSDAGCQTICPSESYQVGRVDDSSYYGYNDLNGAYYYYYYLYGIAQTVDAHDRYSCDDIISLFRLSDDTERFTCDDLENLYGLDCSGCFCDDPVTDAATTRPACSDADAQCGFGWVDPMSCDSLIEASRATLEVYPDELQSHLTCASLEDLGCNCQGCACEREPVCAGTYDYEGTIGVEVLCMGGMSCDYWSARLPGVTCEILEEEYGCNCDYCSCDLEVPDTTPEPECQCEVSYEMESLDGSGGVEMVTCDTFSAFVEPNGLCCGVMEYALQMDCSGCCCDAPACETCLENSTTTSTSTSSTTTTTTTTTTRPCPENDNFYDACSYSSTCSNGEVVRTNLYQRTYDCFWIQNFLDGVCFKPPNAVDCNVTDDQCATIANAATTCRLDSNGDPKCQFCPSDSIPGQPEGPGKAPCYYPNHKDPVTGIADPLYSAYDCVADYQSGKGCVYFNASYDERVDSFCQIKLQNVNCPNPPPACDTVCTPQWLPQGQCSKACGTGQRFLQYNCLPTQEIDGVLVDCGLDPGETLNCEAPPGSVATIGAFNIGACNTDSCAIEGAVCSNHLIGDGYCDWTAEADYARMFSDGELESANNNLDDCDWDGGDCCAYSCLTTDVTPNFWGDPRGATCAWGGGGCHKVDQAGKDAAVAAAFWFNPAGGLGANAGISCTTRPDGFFDCCQDIVLFDSSTLAGSFPCTYGDVDFDKCAHQGNHCLDPAAAGLATTETTPTP